MDDLGLSAESVGASSMFTGEEEIFAFARAVVRLFLLVRCAHEELMPCRGFAEPLERNVFGPVEPDE